MLNLGLSLLKEKYKFEDLICDDDQLLRLNPGVEWHPPPIGVKGGNGAFVVVAQQVGCTRPGAEWD